MGIIKHIDDRLMEIIVRQYHSSATHIVKYHSYTTIFALAIPFIAMSLFKDQQTTFSKIVIVLFFSFGIIAVLMASYAWRHFFFLRKSGLNHVRNYFFEESAGAYRKVAFYFSFFLLIVLKILGTDKGGVEDFQYMLKADFYRLVILTTLETICFIVVILELLRTFLPLAAKWSNRKHLLLFIVLSVVLSVIRAVLLNLVSGHSII
jgi:hypothetical protein